MTTDPQQAPAPPPTETPSGQSGPETPPQQPAPAAAPEQAAPERAAPERAAPERAAPPSHPLPQHRIKRTRTGGIWVAVGFFAVILLLLLIFILQNGQKVDISYLGMHGHLPLGVALLLAAVCGVLLVVLAGTARIGQLRATARRHRRIDAKRAAAAAGEPVGPAR
ncbi:MAG TPA: lipopolysaccharide assembly protein LapA domain-containing protein [Streptosporangiaceae bacterium]|jgi:uncharacterized integral membrane protein